MAPRRRFVRSVLSIAIGALVAYAALVAILFFAQRALLYPGAGDRAVPLSAAWGTAIEVATPDGETLQALHTPAAPGRPTLLFFHGNADDIAHYGFLAEHLAARGIGLFALSWRGYGGSTGSPTEAGLLIDGLAAYDRLEPLAAGSVVVLGQSLGSGVAVHVAAQRPARGVVLIASYDSIAAVARGHYPFLPVEPLIRDSFRSDRRIIGVSQAKLFVHGDRDKVIPLRHGQALFDLASEPKQFSVHAGQGHNDLWSIRLIEDIVAFVEGLTGG